MEGEVILKGLGLLAFGSLFVWLGIVGWKNRREEQISIIEAAILNLADAEPLPHNAWDRFMAYAQPILLLIFGPLMILAGIAVLSLLGE